ncbi:MAG: SDR family NAD(P)-dependent oxidoreductase [Promethearchaeota archaeon]|jgi:3-oxoacyl-[acyl-carrier protein] reductase
MEINGKTAIVTGGAKGIGLDIVEKLIEKGCRVGVFDIDADLLEKLPQKHKEISCFSCDVSDPKQVEMNVESFYKDFKKIDILINNAGIIYNQPLISIGSDGIIKHDIKEWKRTIDNNLSSVFYVTLNVAEKMIMERTKGIIINISSISAAGNPGQGAYSASKAGINSLTSAWSKELGYLGIRVVSVSPGFTDTESTKKSMKEDVLKGIIKKVPLRRLGTPSEIANAILLIIENDFITGKVFEIDGGLII